MFYLAFAQWGYIDDERREIYDGVYEFHISWYYFSRALKLYGGRIAVSKQGGVNFRSRL